MFKLCFLACLLVSFAATAQTAPKVVFVGEDFTTAWQSTPQFTANTNWIGAGYTKSLECLGAAMSCSKTSKPMSSTNIRRLSTS